MMKNYFEEDFPVMRKKREEDIPNTSNFSCSPEHNQDNTWVSLSHPVNPTILSENKKEREETAFQTARERYSLVGVVGRNVT